MGWLLGVYAAAAILIVVGLTVVWSDYHTRRHERHAPSH